MGSAYFVSPPDSLIQLISAAVVYHTMLRNFIQLTFIAQKPCIAPTNYLYAMTFVMHEKHVFTDSLFTGDWLTLYAVIWFLKEPGATLLARI